MGETADGTPGGVEGNGSAHQLFGRDRTELVPRGPDRRVQTDSHAHELRVAALRDPSLSADRVTDERVALRLGRGDPIAQGLVVFGWLVLAGSLTLGVLILINARSVGAFSNPWNSNRVAIGIAVLALGTIAAALLFGVARAITYQLGALRLKLRELERDARRSASRELAS